MTEKCSHRRVTVNEKADYYVCTDIENFRCVFAYDSAPTPTGTGFVECQDCGAVQKYFEQDSDAD